MSDTKTAQDYEREYEGLWASTLKAIEDREVQEALAAGMPVDVYRAHLAEREAHEDLERQRIDLRRSRVASLEPLESRLPVPIYEALVAGRRLPRTPALVGVRNWLLDKSARPFLLMTGVSGTGKTVATAYAMTQIRDCEYLHAGHLAERVNPWSQDLADGFVRANLNARLLVLDELGGFGENARRMEALYAVIDGRQGRVRGREGKCRARTIITSNLGEEELLDTLDSRVVGRLIQNATRVATGTENLRLAQASLRFNGPGGEA